MKLSTKLYQDFKKKTYKVRISLRDLKQKAHLYLKPKAHKEGNPGRPEIGSINYHTSKISEYVNSTLSEGCHGNKENSIYAVTITTNQ